MLSVILCISFFFLSCVFRAIMWRVTTRTSERVGFPTLFGGVIVGYMTNNILPLRAGELVRAYYLKSRTDISLAAAFSTVCIERIFDVFSLGLVMIIGIVYGIQGLTFHNGRIILAALGALLLLSIFTVFLFVTRLNGLGNRQESFLFRLLNMIKQFLKPLEQLKEDKTFIIIMMLSVAAWMSNYLSVSALIHQMSSIYMEAALLLLLFINIGFMIPSSPGALGVMQMAFWMALAPFGILKEDSLALSFIYQGGLFLFSFSIGLPYFLKAIPYLKEVEREKIYEWRK